MAASRPARRPALGHWDRRWLYLIHRWIGIASCLLFAMWFASGLVMIYVPYPSLTPAERLARLEPIAWTAMTSPMPNATGARSIALEMRDGHPIWRVIPWGGEESIVSAEAAHRLRKVDAATARRVAAQFGKAPVVRVEMLPRDQWTVAQRFDRHRPLWKATLGDAAGTELYVSSVTGDVVQDTKRTERFWNWLGSVPHWIYPTVLRKDQPLWRQVILWTSGAGIVGAASGMWIGVVRMRLRRRYKGGRISPYRGSQWLHHVMGLFGGTLLVTWIVSGWLSVDPNRWLASAGVSDAAHATFAAAGPPPIIDGQRLGHMSHAADARRMQMIWTDGTPLLILSHPDQDDLIVDARTLKPAMLERERLVRAAQRLVPGASVEAVDWLTEPDSYWYEAKGPVELPVLRIRFSDPARSWIYISPRTGSILSDVDAKRRLYRWLFDGLHRWDFRELVDRRPLWDVWMWFWLITGVLLSLSGTIIGIRRLNR